MTTEQHGSAEVSRGRQRLTEVAKVAEVAEVSRGWQKLVEVDNDEQGLTY